MADAAISDASGNMNVYGTPESFVIPNGGSYSSIASTVTSQSPTIGSSGPLVGTIAMFARWYEHHWQRNDCSAFMAQSCAE